MDTQSQFSGDTYFEIESLFVYMSSYSLLNTQLELPLINRRFPFHPLCWKSVLTFDSPKTRPFLGNPEDWFQIVQLQFQSGSILKSFKTDLYCGLSPQIQPTQTCNSIPIDRKKILIL